MSSEGLATDGQGQETSVRDDLLAAFSQVKERDAQRAAAEASTGGDEIDDGQAAEQAQGSTPARDASGKFAKQGQAPVEGSDALATVQPDNADQTAGTPTAPATQGIKAPDGLTAAELAAFEKAPPDVQAAFSRRVTELTKKITSQDEDRTFGRKVKEAAQPYAAIMAAEGSSVDQAFTSFLNYNYIMRQGSPQQKVQAIMNVARIFNVPLQQAFQQPQSGHVQTNPAIESLQQRLDRIEQDRQAQERRQREQQDAENQAEIDNFAKDPSHLHFETVKAHMGALLSAGVAKSLKDAYDQACNAHPEIGPTLIAARVAAEQQKQIKTAAAAKKAAGSVTGGPGGARPQAQQPQSTGSIRDDIRAAMAQVNTGRI